MKPAKIRGCHGSGTCTDQHILITKRTLRRSGQSKLALGSQVFSSGPKPFQEMRYSVFPFLTRRSKMSSTMNSSPSSAIFESFLFGSWIQRQNDEMCDKTLIQQFFIRFSCSFSALRSPLSRRNTKQRKIGSKK